MLTKINKKKRKRENEEEGEEEEENKYEEQKIEENMNKKKGNKKEINNEWKYYQEIDENDEEWLIAKKSEKNLDLLPNPNYSIKLNKTLKTKIRFDETNTCFIEKYGYTISMATHGYYEGCYFFEVLVNEPLFSNGHCRVGFSREYSKLNVPVGFDKYSFSYSDVSGKKFHKSYGFDYGDSYVFGDYIGIFKNIFKKKVKKYFNLKKKDV
jgi:hypothetical protein